MEQGNTWSYTLVSGFVKYPLRLKVVKPIAIAGTQGYQLESEAGIYRFTWKDGTLLASSLAGTRFDPPLPYVVSSGGELERTWKGTVRHLGSTGQGTAKLVQKPEEVDVAGRKFKAIKVVTQLTLPEINIETTSYFAEGIGIVQQDQHTWRGSLENKLQTIRLTYLEGP